MTMTIRRWRWFVRKIMLLGGQTIVLRGRRGRKSLQMRPIPNIK
jgi:hypothetical protein